MRYLSVCSGIEAATVAWHPLGWTPVAFSEIEPFPCKVLAHHYPNTPNLGDMTKFKEWPGYDNIDLFVGGTPCQSFSVAGLRKGLDDPRGNLMLTYLAIADRYKPKWIVWENVPGVLSSNGGRDFGTFLGAMEKLGYGFAYRVLDAQFVRTDGYPYAVPQRRRRVFVVGCLGDWGRAAAVLFDSESLRGNPPPRREAGQSVARAATASVGTCSGKPTFGTLMANCGTKLWLGNQEALTGDYHVFDAPAQPIALVGNTIGRQPHNGGNGTGFDESGTMYTLTKTDVHAVCHPINTQIAMRHEALGEGTGFGIGADGDVGYTLQAAHHHAVAFQQNTRDEVRLMNGDGQIAGALAAQAGMKQQNYVAFGVGEQPDLAHCLRSGASKADKHESTTYVAQSMQVRRLTPRECERLQAFPDNYTNIPGASDTTRYKALGNSMAVNVMALIGERIRYVETVIPA